MKCWIVTRVVFVIVGKLLEAFNELMGSAHERTGGPRNESGSFDDCDILHSPYPGTALVTFRGGGTEGQKLIAKGQYAQGLGALEHDLKADPLNPSLLLSKVDALMGLHRTLEARSLALMSVSLGPAFRFRAGTATAKLGQMTAAVELWEPLLIDQQWAALAYTEAAKAIIAVGDEAQAKLLIARAMQNLPVPSTEILRLNLKLNTGKESGLATLARLKTIDPRATANYDALMKLYGTANGALYQEALEGHLPAIVELKEKSERVEQSTLRWGGPPTGVIRSGEQAYTNLSNEGAKTGTISTIPRVIVEPRVNGESVDPFVLDSATDTLIITPRMVKKLKLEKFAPAHYDGIGLAEAVPSSWVLLREFRVGPVVFKNIPALVLDAKTDFWKETGASSLCRCSGTSASTTTGGTAGSRSTPQARHRSRSWALEWSA